MKKALQYLQMALAPFSRLASVYDEIMLDVEYEDWIDFILQLVQVRGKHPENALDIGCGTGNSSLPMFARGVEIMGLDASRDMLELAREKLPPVKFVEADFRNFDLNKRFDLVYSVFDSLNNLLEITDFLKAARCVYKHLEPGGFFVFDANTTVGLKYLWESGRAEGYINDVHYAWEHYFDENTGLAKVEAYCEKEGKGFTEIHYERAYDAPELVDLLGQAGFTNIEALSYPDAALALKDDPRIWMIAQKPS